MKNNSITRSLCLCAAALGLSLSTSQAANVLKSDTASMLTNAVNWATVPATTDIGEFSNIPQSAHLAAMTLGGTMTLRGLVFDNNMTGPLVIGSAASTYLTNGVAGIDMSQANQSVTFNNLIALSQPQTWKVAAGQSNIVNGVVSGPGFLTLGSATTPGTVYFGSQANVYPGGTLINGGTVVINATGSLGSGAVTNNGGILVLSHGGISPFVNSIVISNTTSVIDDSYFAGNDNMIGNWAGGGTVTISNMATYQTTFTFGGNNSSSTMNNFSGKIIVAPVTGTNGPAEGTLRFNSGNTSYNVGSSAMSIDLGPYPSAVTLMQRNGAAGPTGQIFNVGELKGGTSTSVIGSRQSNSTITYSIGGANTSTTYAGTMTNSFGGNTATTSINKTLYGGGVLGLQKVGSGTLTLTGTNYYTGNTTFSGGVLNAGAGEATAATQNPNFVWAAPTWYGGPFGEPTNLTQSQFIFNGGTLQYSSMNNADYSGRFATNTAQAISIDVNGQNVTFATALTDYGTGSPVESLTNHDTAGGGSLTLTAAETYSGNTTIASGTLALSGGGALPATTVLNIKTNGTFDVSALTSPSLGTISLIANGMGTLATASTIKAPAGGVDIGSQTVTLLWSGALVGTDSTHPPLTVSGGPLNLNGNTMDIVVSGTPQQFLLPGVYTLIATPAPVTGTVNATPSFAGGNGIGFAETATVSISGNNVILTVTQLPVITWTDVNSDQLWSTVNNWLPVAAPPQAAGNLANFGTAANTAISLNQNASIGGALFTNANSYTITATGANALTADNSGAGAEIEVTTGGTANNIAAPINLNDNLATVVFANQSLKLSGVIANTAGAKTLTISGLGTNILTQANTYGPAAGGLVGTILNSGSTLQVGNNSSLGAGDLSVVNGGGMLKSGAAGLTLANNIGVTNTTLTANNNGNTFTLGGVISGSGGLTASGSGITSLSGWDTFTGANAISNGVLQISGAGQWGGASGNGTNGATIVDNGTLDFASSAAQLLTGNISGTGGITVDSGTLALQGQNSFTGNIVVNSGGTLSVQTVENVNVPAVGSLGNVQTPGQTATINSGGLLTLDANGGNEFGGGSSSSLINFIINGGTMRITNNNAEIGPVTFTGTGGVMDQINTASTGTQYGAFELGAGVSVGGTGSSTMQSTVGGYYNLTVNSSLPYGLIYVTNSAAVLNISAKLANSGGSQGVAGLLKDGAGTLNLSAANAYTGDTIVSNGTLALVSGGTINTSPHVIVLSGATMDYSAATSPTLASGQILSGTNGTVNGLVTSAGTISPGATPGGTGAAGTLKFNNGLNLSGSTAITMEYSATNHGAGFTNDLIAVNGNLTVSGPITISLAWFGGSISNGVYPVITYTGSYSGSGNVANDFGAIIPGSAATLVATNILAASGSNVIAVIVAPPARPTTNLVWIGDAVGDYWSSSMSVSNWVAGAVTNAFQAVDTVTFADLSQANLANTNVTLSGVLYPTQVIVANSSTSNSPVYSLNNGAGASIAGAATLIKTNTGTLVLSANGNYNNYTGPTIIDGGTLWMSVMENSGVASPIGSSGNDPSNLVFNGGTLYFGANGYSTDRGATMATNGGSFNIVNGGSLTFSGVFTGPGSLTMNNSDLGSGSLTLTGANTYTNGTVASSGTLTLGNTAAAGTGPITFNGGTVNISSGGTFLNNINATTNGGLLTGSQLYQINGTITMPSNSVLNISVIGGGLAGSTNTMTFNSNFVASAGSVIRVKNGTYGFMRMLATSGTTNATIDLGSSYVMLHTKTPANIIDIGGLMGQQGTALGGSRSAAGATTWRIGANGSNTVFSGTISNNLDSSNGTIGNPTVVNIIKVGTGMLTLTADETYNGTTTISNGVLQVENNGQYDGNLGLYGGIYGTTMTNGIYDGALSNCPVVISGGTLAGNGTIVSGISNQYGGTLQPGYGVSTPGTVMTVSNLTMVDGSSTVMLVKHSTTPDSLTVNGVLDYGGILTVNKASGDTAYSLGDNYTLFNFSGTGSYDGISTFATIQPPPGAGLGWQLTPGSGIITVVSATAPTAGFTATPLNPLVGGTVTFVNSSANANYWVWNFGDGTTLITGSNTNVPHAYANAGTYTVVQSAYSPGGSNGLTRTSYITVTPAAPTVVFSGGPTNIFVTGTVTLTDGSADNGITPVTNIWNFGDGHYTTNVTADISVTHVYTNAGTYTVNLAVSDLSGNSSSNAPNYVTVHSPAQLGAVSATGGNMVFSGAVSGMTGQYRILATNNISAPLSSWPVVKTGTFGAGGSYSYTAPTGAGPAYYIMSVP